MAILSNFRDELISKCNMLPFGKINEGFSKHTDFANLYVLNKLSIKVVYKIRSGEPGLIHT